MKVKNNVLEETYDALMRQMEEEGRRQEGVQGLKAADPVDRLKQAHVSH